MVGIFTGSGTGFERGSGALLGASGLIGSSVMGRGGEQVFVNGANGNLLISRQDEFMVGRGPDVGISRTYNSLGNFSDDNGDNWRQSTDRALVNLTGSANQSGSTITRRAGDGSELVYTYDTVRGLYTSIDGAGAADTLKYSAGSSKWAWIDGDTGDTEIYTAYGDDWRIASKIDTSGYSLTFGYTDARLTTISTSDGGVVTYNWDSNGNIVSIRTSSHGITLTRAYYSYDSANRLTRVTTDLTPGDEAIGDGETYWTQYTYVGDSKLVASITQKDGSHVEFTYDESNRIQTVTETVDSGVIRTTTLTYGIDSETGNHTVSITDPLDQVTVLEFASETPPDDGGEDGGGIEVGGGGGGAPEGSGPFGVHQDGQLLRITLPAAYSGAAPQIIEFDYNEDGDLISMTDAAGAKTHYEYDGSKNLTTVTDALNHQIVRNYGSQNELLSETRIGSDATSSGTVHTVRYVYDQYRNLSYIVDADGAVTAFYYESTITSPWAYAGSGLLVAQETFLDHRYTDGGPITLSEMYDWCTNIGSTGRTQSTDMHHDERGEVSSTSSKPSPFGGSWPRGGADDGYSLYEMSHDTAGNLISRTRMAEGQGPFSFPSPVGPTETFVFDGLGRLKSTTDKAGTVTTITFDDAATKTTVTIAATGLVRTSIYDKLGHLLSVAEGGDPISAAPDGTSRNRYDAAGQLRRTTDATGHVIHFVYDHAGRKVADINQDGYVTEYRYDGDNRLVGTIHYATSLSPANLTTLATNTQNGTFTDLSVIRPGSSNSDISAWQVYDADGRLVEAVEGDGSVTAYAYDESDRLIATTAYYYKLSAAQLASVKSGGQPPILPVPNSDHDSVARNFYDANGRLIAVLDGEGYLSQTVYDPAGHKLEVIAYATATNPAPSARATWTLAQLLSGLANTATDSHTHFVYDRQGFLRFEIDALNRVTEFTYGTGSDVSGLVRSETHFAGTIASLQDYTIGSVTSALSTASLTDSPNNRTTWAVYDSADRLAYSIDALGLVTGYTYDAAGHVIKTVQFKTARQTSALPTKADMDNWAAGAGLAADRVTRTFYNGRGELRFTVDAENYVTRNDYDESGRVVGTYRWDGRATTTLSDNSTMAEVQASVSGAWTHQTFAYDSNGRLTTTTDGEGYRHDFQYRANGTLASEIVALGTADEARTNFDYDAAGRMTAQHVLVETGAWLTTSYGYDGEGNQTSVADNDNNLTTRSFDRAGHLKNVNSVLSQTSTITTSFGYDAFGNQTSIVDGNNHTTLRAFDRAGQLVCETDAEGRAAYYSYDAFGEVVRTTDRAQGVSYSYYDKDGRLTLSVDPLNYGTETTYTSFGEVGTVTRYATHLDTAPTVGTRPVFGTADGDATTQFKYDNLGRLTKSIDAMEHYEQYTLDAFGNRIIVRNKLGGLTHNTFDRRGLLIAETLPTTSSDSGGLTVASSVTNHFAYDARGNRKEMVEAFGLPEHRTTTYDYDKADRLKHTGGDVPSVSYTYDSHGNVIKTTDALEKSSFSYYDAVDRKIAEIDAVGTLSTYDYDGNGNLTKSRIYGTTVALPTNAGGPAPTPPGGPLRETSSTYDKINRVTSSTIANVRQGAWNAGSSGWTSTAPGDATTFYEYGVIGTGEVVHVIGASGGGDTYTYYDLDGHKIFEVDQEGFATSWENDAEGNVVTERRYAAPVSHAGLDGVTLHAEQPADRLTTFKYDKNGLRKSETRHGVQVYSLTAGGIPTLVLDDSTVAYTYNEAGQVTKKTEATGEAVDYSYDESGRLTQERRAAFHNYDTGLDTSPTVRYFYDGLGNLVRTEQGQITSGGATVGPIRATRNAYDAGGRLTQTTDARGNTHDYSYDAAGNVSQEMWRRTGADVLVSGQMYGLEGMKYERDALGRVTRQSVYNINGNAWLAAGDYFTTAYNAYGDVIARGTDRGLEGAQERFLYDNAGRLSGSDTGDGVWRYYFYDGAGHQTLILENEGRAGFSDLESGAALTIGADAAAGNLQDGVVATINVVDRRGLVTQVRMPQRELSGATKSLTVTREYNAFGEVVSEQDSRDNLTLYSYNAMGRVTTIIHPTVTVVGADSIAISIHPTDHLFSDISGRLVASGDANDHYTIRDLLAGSGYGGTDALVTRETHADGGFKDYDYDSFGELRKVTDELVNGQRRWTEMAYDGMGHLIQTTHNNGLTDTFFYDELGQQTKHTNSVLGTDLTTYDIMGRVSSRTDAGNYRTAISTVWVDDLPSAGLGATGGWVEATTYANGKSGTQTTDQFGHLLAKTDLGGHSWQMTYDAAGRMIARSGQDSATYQWNNTGLVKLMQAGDQTATYAYDEVGNRVVETLTKGDVTFVNASATFDAMGRMTHWQDAGSGHGSTRPGASIDYKYDAVGNIRNSKAQFTSLDQQGHAMPDRLDAHGNVVPDGEQNYWYLYDNMNRVVLAKGTLSGEEGAAGTTITRGPAGATFTYDAAGQRRTMTQDALLTAMAWKPGGLHPTLPPGNNGEGEGGDSDGSTQGEYVTAYYYGEHQESYVYDDGGALSQVKVAETEFFDNNNGTVRALGFLRSPTLIAQFTNDSAGRVTHQVDYSVSVKAYERSVFYNAAGQVSSETVITHQGNDTFRSEISHQYGAGTSYALGAEISSDTDDYKNDVFQTHSHTGNDMSWWDGAVVHSSTYTKTGQADVATAYLYGADGSLQSVGVGGTAPYTVAFTNDMNGQAIARDRGTSAGTTGTTAPHEVWYRYGGKAMGYVGNNGTLDTDYATSIKTRAATPPATPGPFRGGAAVGPSTADFDQSLAPINSYSQGGAGGSYEVHAGDTLSTIAAQLWGDASLWFRLAEANGLGANSALVEGQRLSVPAGVIKNTHNATTFNPYDPSEVIGDVGPAPSPAAPKKSKCGVFGQILIAVVAVAISVALPELAPGVFGASGALGAVGGAVAASVVGNVASQAVGLATGIQDKFDWKGLAMAGISAGVGAGVGQVLGKAGVLGSKVLTDLTRGALGSAITQGIGVVTGLQSKFDWVGIAASGIGSAAGGIAGRALPGRALDGFKAFGGYVDPLPATFGNIVGASAADLLASATARSLVEGTSFGNNVLEQLPSTIANTIGALVANTIAARDLEEDGKSASNTTSEENDVTSNKEFSSGGEKYLEKTSLTTFDQDPVTVTQSSGNKITLSDGITIRFEEGGSGSVYQTILDMNSTGRAPELIWQMAQHWTSEATADQILREFKYDWRAADNFQWTLFHALKVDNQVYINAMYMTSVRDLAHSLETKVLEHYAYEADVRYNRDADARRREEAGLPPREEFLGGGAIGSFAPDPPSNSVASSGPDIIVTAQRHVARSSPSRSMTPEAPPSRASYVDYLSPGSQRYIKAHLPRSVIEALGPSPSDMLQPHRHHILPVNGRRGEERALIREGQAILRDVGIDPLMGLENLTWAPNRGHTMAASGALVRALRANAGRRDQIVETLRLFGEAARARKGN